VAPASITIAVASRPHPTETVNGDTWAIDWHDGACRIAVVDGLGHGPQAAAAALAAREALAAHPDLLPAAALMLLHTALRGTRGAAISIAHVDPASGSLTYAGVGNVEARLWQDGKAQRLLAYRGIVGSVLPTVRAFTSPLTAPWLLALHTDGVSARFELEATAPAALQAAADDLLACWGRGTDDATIVLAAPAPAQKRHRARRGTPPA
jgi:serine phosphatase RsbU (regulator of sigma subunit)